MTHYFSGKMIFRETSFRESDCPGNVLSGKRLSGKVTFRETSVNRLRASATQSGIHYNFISKLYNGYDTTKILSWLWLHRHEGPQNSIPARISNNASPEFSVICGVHTTRFCHVLAHFNHCFCLCYDRDADVGNMAFITASMSSLKLIHAGQL